MSIVALPLPRPATPAGIAGRHRPIVHIGCPNREVSLCRAERRDGPGQDVALPPNCVVCLDLASRERCPDCGADHRLPEAC